MIILMAGFWLGGCQADGSASVSDSQTTEKHYVWPGYSLTEAVEKADHIIYGQVTGKKSVMVKTDSSQGAEERRNEISLQVIKVLKASDTVASNSSGIVYYEIPAADESTANDIPVNLKDGQAVILFLNQYSRTLGPAYVIPVEQEKAILSPFLKSSDFKDLTGDLGVDDLCQKIIELAK